MIETTPRKSRVFRIDVDMFPWEWSCGHCVIVGASDTFDRAVKSLNRHIASHDLTPPDYYYTDGDTI